MSEQDVDVLARTIWGEARGEGFAGQVAVGWAIRNRVEADLGNDGKPDWWGEGYVGVCKAPWQFSCWNKNDPFPPSATRQHCRPASRGNAAGVLTAPTWPYRTMAAPS